jgi:hypothetical protein
MAPRKVDALVTVRSRWQTTRPPAPRSVSRLDFWDLAAPPRKTVVGGRPARSMHHPRPADLIVGRIAVGLQNAFELSQKLLWSVAPAAQTEIKQHSSSRSARTATRTGGFVKRPNSRYSRDVREAYICRFVVACRQRHFVPSVESTESGRHLFDIIGGQPPQASLVVPITYKSAPSGRSFARSPEPTPDSTATGILGCRRISSFPCPMRVLFAQSND